MSVIDVREVPGDRRGSIRDGKRTYSHGFLVRTDDPHDTQAIALGASGVPSYRMPHWDHNAALALEFTCEPHDNSPKHWKIRVDFSAPENDAGQPTLHPLQRPATFSYGANEYTEPLFLDEHQPPRAYVNSAGSPFESVCDRNRSELQITMQRNEAFFSPIDAHEFADTTCSHDVHLGGYGYRPGTLLMGMPTAEPQSEFYGGQTVDYFSVTRTFRARAGGWDDKLIDVGLDEILERPGPSGTIYKDRVPIVDGAGVRIARPWPLDGEGHALPDPSGTPATIERRPYKRTAWPFVGQAPEFPDLGENQYQYLE